MSGYVVLGRTAYPLSSSVTLSEFHALSYLLPILAQPSIHDERLHIAALNPQDAHTAHLIICALRSARVHKIYLEARQEQKIKEGVRKFRRAL